MSPSDAVISLAILRDPWRRRELTRQAGIVASRLGLRGGWTFEVAGTSLVVICEGRPVAIVDAFETGLVGHD